MKTKITYLFLLCAVLLLSRTTVSQVVILQQGFDSTSGSQSNGTWTNVDQIQNGGNTWTNSGTGNDVIEGNYSCSGWSTCNDKTGHTYGITGGAPNFKGTGTNVGYLGTNSTYFASFDDYDASSGTYGTIYTPTFSLANYTSCNLTFYWNNANTSSSYIQVQYWNGSSWTGATNFGTGTGSLGWHAATMSLPSTATEVVIFVVSDFYYYAIGIDQIEIYGTPSCTTPTATISSSTNVNCYGQSTGSATVTTNGSSPTYSWAPSGGTSATASSLAAGTYTVTVTVPGGCNKTATVSITQPSSAVSGSISSTNVSPCSISTNGTATVTASGGTSPYTYSWTPSSGLTGATTTTAGGMSKTSYTCTITDAKGCTATPTVTIGGPAAVMGSISSQTNVSCYGGSTGAATISASGGTSPYTYSWSPSGGTTATASNLAAGTYTCTITDAHSCTGTVTVTITQPSAALSASINSHTNVNCYGQSTGSATVTASNGTSPYTYSWSPSGGTNATASNLAAGNYTVTVTDHNSCTTTATVTLTQPSSAVRDSISAQTNVLCNGENNGSATVGVKNGTSPYTYSWSSGEGTHATASSLTAGTYTCTVTDHNGCSSTVVATITQPAVFQGTIEAYSTCGSNNTGAVGVDLTGGTLPYTYSWSPNVSTTDTAYHLAAGTYSVTVNDANGCGPLVGTATVTTITAETVSVTSHTNINCYGQSTGSATATASPTVNYIWSPGGSTNATISSLATGTYTVTSTETDGCVASATVGITQPSSAVSASISSTNVSPCSTSTNGTATVTASGGTSPYTYSWTPSSGLTGATTTTAGGMSKSTYTCTVTDAKGCVATATVTIGGPTAVTSSISSQTNESCYGGNTGSVTIASASGGTSPYTYNWTPSGGTTTTASNLSAGTYTCTITDAHSCTGTVTVTITQPNQLRDSISSSTNVLCHGATTGSVTVGVKGGTSPYTYSWSPSGGTNATASNLAAGSYTVTVTDHNSCTNTATVTITQPSAIRDSINAQTNVLCNGENNGSATVGVKGGTTPYTYSWAPSGGTHATVSSRTAGTYTCTITDHNGCTSTVITTITQPAVFGGFINTYNICGSGTGQIGVDLTGGTPPYTYSWSPNVSTTDTAYGLASGSSYTVTVNDANGCGPLVGTATISTITAETVTVTSSNVSCYGGNNGSATATGNPTHAYVWSPGGSTNATISGLTAGAYTVVATETDGCTAIAIATITQPAVITPAITYTNTCSGSTNGTANVSVSGGISPYTYSWSPSGGTNATASNLAAGNYTVTITDHNSCVATATVTIGTNPLPTLTVTPSPAPVCIGSSTSLTVSGASTYSWSPSTGLNVTTGATVSANPTSTKTYTVTGTNSNGCVNTQTVVVTVNPLPTLTITPSSATICSGGSTSLTASGASTYTWSPSTGLNATTGATVSATLTVTTTYTVTGTNSNGCVNTQTVVVTVNPLPTLTITPSPAAVCKGSSTSITASGASTYTWGPSTGLNVTTGAVVTANPSSTITYTVTGTNSNGCVNTQTVVLTVNPSLTVDISNIIPVSCYGGANGSAQADIIGGTSPFTYSWNNLMPTQTTAAATGLSAATYSVTVTDAHSCAATATVTIVQPTLFTVSASSTPVCGSTSGSATAIPAGGTSGYSYHWSPSGGNNATASNLSAGTYTVTATDANGCGATASAVVVTNATPSVSISPPTSTIYVGGMVTLNASGSMTYSWNTGSTEATIIVTPTSTTVYTVTGMSGGGCTATATATVTVNTANVPTSCDTCIGVLNFDTGRVYLISVWAKNHTSSPDDTTYLNPNITVSFPSAGTSFGPFYPSGRIIDGWQRIEGQFKVPHSSTDFAIQLACKTGGCNFDDMRVFPFNGTLKTYVYDPNTLRLVAVLDERNYATIYEYDEEGKLIRVKKETERGIMTIQESRTSMQKQK